MIRYLAGVPALLVVVGFLELLRRELGAKNLLVGAALVLGFTAFGTAILVGAYYAVTGQVMHE